MTSRLIFADHVLGDSASPARGIESASIEGPNLYAGTCWACRRPVARREGRLVRLHLEAAGGAANPLGTHTLFAPVHETSACTDQARQQIEALARGHRWNGLPRSLDGAEPAALGDDLAARTHRELRTRAQEHGLAGLALANARKAELLDYLRTDPTERRAVAQAIEARLGGARTSEDGAELDPEPDDSLEAILARRLAGLVQTAPDPAALEAAVEDVIARRLDDLAEAVAAHTTPQVQVLEIRRPDREPVVIEGAHALLPDAVSTLSALGVLWLVGPKGSGKSTLARQCAEALGLPFTFNSCSLGMSEAHVLGRMLFDGTYVPAAFVIAYESGGAHLWDEIDNADPNVMNAINEALANGSLSVPNRKDAPVAHRSPDFRCIAASNTWGTGQGTEEYTGREALDAAFRSRFTAATLYVDYDPALEKRLARALGIEPLLPAFSTTRANAERYRLRRDLSTRALVHLGRLHRADPTHWTAAKLWERLTVGWTPEERAKATERLAPGADWNVELGARS